MSGLLSRISETRENRVKATKVQMDEVRELLPKPEEGRLAIPECMSADDGDWDFEAFAVMAYVMGKQEDPEYTLERARDDSGLHTIRIMAPELSYFYGRTGDKKKVEEHWVRVFEVVDSFDRCPHCNGTRVPAWIYCGWCGHGLREEAELRMTQDEFLDLPMQVLPGNPPEKPTENPTPSETSSEI